MYYIQKNFINNLINKRNSFIGINHILSPMGSGKSTAIKNFINNNTDKDILVLAPYRVVKNEFKDLVNQISKLEYDYMVSICYECAYSINENINTAVSHSHDYITELIQAYFKSLISKYEYIFIDEIDFVYIQAFKDSSSMIDTNLYEEDGNTHSLSLMITLFFMEIMYSRKTIAISISANKLEVPPRTLKVAERIHAKVVKERFDEEDSMNRILNSYLIKTYNTELKSSLNISSVTMVYVDNEDNNRSTNVLSILNYFSSSSDRYSLIFKSGKYTSKEIDILSKNNCAIVNRLENLPKKYNKKSLTLSGGIQGYENLYIIGKELDNEDMLSDDMLDKHNNIAIGVSSSRAVSITKADKEANVLIITNSITTTITQIIGRFRKAKQHIYIITTNEKLYNSNLYREFYKRDEFIADDVYDVLNRVSFKDFNKRSFSKLRKSRVGKAIGKSVGKAIGKNLSETTVLKRKGINDFIEKIFDSELSLNKNYLKYKTLCDKNEMPSFGKAQFIKLSKMYLE